MKKGSRKTANHHHHLKITVVTAVIMKAQVVKVKAQAVIHHQVHRHPHQALNQITKDQSTKAKEIERS